MKGERIAVIGAGPMGLGVAYQLASMGYVPVVFESDDRIGGMTATFDFGGLDIERYYHFHCISDSAFLDVLQELGLQERVHWVETKMGYFHQGKLQPWGNPVALLMFSGLGPVAKFRYGLHAFLSTRRNDWKALDRLEATGWIRRWVGDEAFEVLWSKLFKYKFYEYANSLSAAWIWSRIRRIGRSRYDLFHEKLGYLEGGSATLLESMRAFIEKEGGEFLLGMPVERIEITDGAVRGVLAGGEFMPFSKVISTVPLPCIPAMIPGLPEELMQMFLSVKNIAVVCVIVKLRKPVTENFWLNVNDPAMDIPGLIEYTNLRPMGGVHIVYVPFYMPGENPKYSDDDHAYAERVTSYLKTINPSLCDTDFVMTRVHRYRYAQPVCGPGYLDTLPTAGLPVKGLWVADTSYYYPEDRGISEGIGFGRKLAKEVTA
ncbi:MAG: NAD(P)/FAD-dependent oxidoreductase [Chlorobium limicola]|uniref:NAD(P)/FAD-dependent oxidoreductase n=1 Tax=Chlorobium limicola TaxID=1092 RepID=UPI0023F4AC9D|nr:NAD(P)/FAD-dependent oxidoreductase [Chlorobium limicola]NTV21838.1 NAD(P)/FAD-dependent oxidoreductase [Chlorobium limicola]NTV98193.1 NAD(P)/FAD-dependent oxidoreductase [Chlorobiaceae bacterium]